MLESINILLSGIIVGMIVFQSAIIAPTIFTTLDEQNAGKIIRNIFPKLFKFIAFLGLYMLTTLIFISSSYNEQIVYAFTFIFMTINFLIIPATNKSRDEGDDKKFKFLHTVSVVTTMLVIIAHSYLIIF